MHREEGGPGSLWAALGTQGLEGGNPPAGARPQGARTEECG